MAIFCCALVLIELNRRHWLPAPVDLLLPTNHLKAIEFVFSLVLVMEVISLIFSLVYSLSTSVGKQVEILSLVLLREVFKEFAEFSEPLVWQDVAGSVLNMGAHIAAALAIFIILGFYYRAQRRAPLTHDEQDNAAFILAKKALALGLLLIFAGILVVNSYRCLVLQCPVNTFATFYTVLIFSDILMMLLAMRYGSSYRVAFRNSAFAVATVLIRLALITPPFYDALLGIGSAVLVLGIRYAYNFYIPSSYQQQREQRRRGTVLES